MKKILIEKDIQSYFVFGNSLFFLKNKNIFQDEKLILSHIESFGIKNEFAFFHKQENDKLVSIQLNHNNELVIHNYPIDAEICFENNAFLGLNYDRLSKTYEYFCYNLLEKTIKKVNNFNSNSIHHKVCFPYIIYKTKNQFDIGSYHLPTETTLWQYSVSDLGAEKVSKILGVFGEVLLVVCDYSKEIEISNGQKNTYPYEKIIGLNKNTGQLLYEVDGYELDGEYKLFGPSSCSLFVYNDGETILHALIGFYLTFDTQTGETKTLNIDVQAHDRGISAVKSASFDRDGIGFSAYDFKVGGFDSVVGVFNTKTLKIEDHYTNEDANKEGAFFGPGQPKIHGNKIYALDTKNTLHIFERE